MTTTTVNNHAANIYIRDNELDFFQSGLIQAAIKLYNEDKDTAEMLADIAANFSASNMFIQDYADGISGDIVTAEYHRHRVKIESHNIMLWVKEQAAKQAAQETEDN